LSPWILRRLRRLTHAHVFASTSCFFFRQLPNNFLSIRPRGQLSRLDKDVSSASSWWSLSPRGGTACNAFPLIFQSDTHVSPFPAVSFFLLTARISIPETKLMSALFSRCRWTRWFIELFYLLQVPLPVPDPFQGFRVIDP